MAVSGGADSVFLLRECVRYASKLDFRIVVAHIDHGLRGKASQQDALFVKKLAQKYDLPFELLCIDVKKIKGNIEEIGRNARYQFLEKIRLRYKADWIVTAHHQDDNIETVLFNFIRGASYQGLKGMNLIDQKRHLLRPLLEISKKEILRILKKRRQNFRIDQSNKDLHYSRNLLRHNVIPLFEKINSGFKKTFLENLKNFNEIAEFLDEKTNQWLKKNYRKDAFPLKKFLGKPVFFQKNILATLYRNTYGSTARLNQQHLNSLLHLFQQKKSNRKKEFGPKYFLEIIREEEKNERFVRLKNA